MYEFVDAKRLTVVLGTSGAGKSSLVKAGLIPELRENQSAWTILDSIRPGESPFRELNNSLKKANLPEVEVSDAAGKSKNLNESIKVWKSDNPNSKLLLFIDQSEELITLCKDPKERDNFLIELADAITNYPELRVVITVRSDFEPQLRYLHLDLLPSLLKLKKTAIDNIWQTGRFIVPAMTRDELREAIEKPAEKRVMYFKPHNLVETLIDEVAGMPGALPLLSFALSELYLNYLKRQQEGRIQRITIDRAITQEDYKQIGGVTQSLTKRADEEYQKLINPDPDYEQIVRNVMLRMVTLDGGEVSRRRVAMSELEYSEKVQPQVDEVIKRFSDARLLIKGTDAENNPYVEPAHDALVKGWDKLRFWMNQEKETLLLQQRLTLAANDWKKNPESLWTEENGRLLKLRQVINSDRNWLNKVETEFVSKSIEAKRKRLEEEEKQRDEALQGQITALAALSEARFQDDQLGALIHILKAGRILQQLRDSKSQWIQKEVSQRTEAILLQILGKIQEYNRLETYQDQSKIESIDFSNNGEIVTVNHNGIVKFWQQDGKILDKSLPQNLRFSLVAFRPNSQTIAAAIGDAVWLWNLDDGKLIKILSKYTGSIRAIAFNSNGKMLATASMEGDYKN